MSFWRTFSFVAAVFTVVLAALWTISWAETRTVPARSGGPPASAADAFVGEELTYNLGFWFFSGVAVGKISLEKQGDIYVATLKAHTTGIAAWLRHREDTYIARFERAPGSDRFRTLSFEEDVTIGSKHRRTVTLIDYERGVMRWRKWKNGRLRKSGEFIIPPGAFYDDPITAFYNLRRGVYGPIEGGREYLIKTLPSEEGEDVDIYLRIATEDEFRSRTGGEKAAARYLADVKMPGKLFDSKSGKMEILFDASLIPVWAVAKDIIFFGDVWGELVESSRTAGID